MGKSQQAAGAALERDLDRFHATLKGWYVQRNHPKDYRTKGPPDYLALRGVAVLFDAKNSGGDHWSLHLLKPHQAIALDQFANAGGISALYLRLATGDVFVPWSKVTPRWRTWYATRQADRLTAADGVAVFGCDWTRALDSLRGAP